MLLLAVCAMADNGRKRSELKRAADISDGVMQGHRETKISEKGRYYDGFNKRKEEKIF